MAVAEISRKMSQIQTHCENKTKKKKKKFQTSLGCNFENTLEADHSNDTQKKMKLICTLFQSDVRTCEILKTQYEIKTIVIVSSQQK